MNGSRDRVGCRELGFRVGLNQMAGSLGGAASPGYFREEKGDDKTPLYPLISL